MASGQRVIIGNALDVLKTLPEESIDCVVTSPPYFNLRSYGTDPVTWDDGQVCELGREEHYDDYIRHLCDIFDEVKRVLKPTGTLFVNLGDSYGGSGGNNTSTKDEASKWKAMKRHDPKRGKVINDYDKAKGQFRHKSLILIPQRFVVEMYERGWYVRNDIIWHKPSVVPNPVKDRFTVDHEYVFFFTKSDQYDFEQQREPLAGGTGGATRAKEYMNMNLDGKVIVKHNDVRKAPMHQWKTGGTRDLVMNNNNPERFAPSAGRNMRTVWTINPSGSDASSNDFEHIAKFPLELVRRMVSSGCPPGGTVLDPFCGSGTTLEYCRLNDIDAIGIEINPAYGKVAKERCMANVSQLEKWFP